MPLKRLGRDSYAKKAGLALLLLGATGLQAKAQVLGTASNFGVLAGSTVTNTGPTVIFGDIGVSPGTAITGFPPGIGGTQHSNDAVAMQAQNDLTTAYNNIAGEAPTLNLTGQDLGGLTLTPGVYFFSSSAQLTGTLNLNGLGNPNARFDFRIGSTLTTASASIVNLLNGASGNNIYWQVGSSATLGTTSMFEGNVLALTSITATTGVTDPCGRLLARNGAVTLDSDTIGGCSSASGTPEPSTSALLVCFGMTSAFALLRRRCRSK